MELPWHYARGGQTFGPIPFAELKKLVAAGEVQPTDSVRQEGTFDWLPASQVPDLLAPPAIPPPPPLPLPEVLPLPEQPLQLEIDESPPIRADDEENGQRGRGAKAFESVMLHMKRAFASEMRTIPITEDEERRLHRNGIKEPIAQRYFVWRRSILWFLLLPCGFAALFHFIQTVDDKYDAYSRFGAIMIYLQMISLFALPVSAVFAALKFDQPRKSTSLLLFGAIISFAVPMLFALVPAEQLLEAKMHADAERTGAGLVFGLVFFLLLLPSILSILPAIGRACVQVKSLLPTSIAPGWGLLASGPLYVLIGFAAFILLYHVAGNLLLIVGVILWVGSPLIYLTRASVLIRPITRTKDFQSIARVRTYVFISVTAGIVLICIFLFTAKFLGKYLVGTEKATSWARPWSLDLHAMWIEFVGRSLFLTVLFADLLMKMNLSIWKQEKEFALTEYAADYDKDMTDLSASLEPPPAKHDDNDDDRHRRRERDGDRY